VSTRTRFREGARAAAGPAAATFVLGLSFGAAAAAAGWGVGAPLAFSAFAFSGSAQFSLLTTLPAGSAVAAVTSAILINTRYLVMGIALNDSLRGSRAWRAVQSQALVDASFVVAHQGGGRFDVARLFGATVPQWVCWLLGTLIGALSQPDPELLRQLGADVVFPAFFLLLALEEVRNPRAVVAALCGAAVAGALLLVTEPGYALLAATAGALVGALPDRAGFPPQRSPGESSGSPGESSGSSGDSSGEEGDAA
jgi:4-azaleucine resistance transporter AzlC